MPHTGGWNLKHRVTATCADGCFPAIIDRTLRPAFASKRKHGDPIKILGEQVMKNEPSFQRAAVEAVSDACMQHFMAELSQANEGHSVPQTVPQRAGGQQPRAHPRDNRRENKLSVWEGPFFHRCLIFTLLRTKHEKKLHTIYEDTLPATSPNNQTRKHVHDRLERHQE